MVDLHGVIGGATTGPNCSKLAQWQVLGPKARAKALKGGHGEPLRRRKQPQQAPSAQGKLVVRSPPGANLLHSAPGLAALEITPG